MAAYSLMAPTPDSRAPFRISSYRDRVRVRISFTFLPCYIEGEVGFPGDHVLAEGEWLGIPGHSIIQMYLRAHLPFAPKEDLSFGRRYSRCKVQWKQSRRVLDQGRDFQRSTAKCSYEKWRLYPSTTRNKISIARKTKSIGCIG